MKEIEYLFYKLATEGQAIAIDLAQTLTDPTSHNDKFVFSEQTELVEAIG